MAKKFCPLTKCKLNPCQDFLISLIFTVLNIYYVHIQEHWVTRYWNNLSKNDIIFRLGFITSVISFLQHLLEKGRKTFQIDCYMVKNEQLTSISLEINKWKSFLGPSRYKTVTVDNFFPVAVWFYFFFLQVPPNLYFFGVVFTQKCSKQETSTKSTLMAWNAFYCKMNNKHTYLFKTLL